MATAATERMNGHGIKPASERFPRRKSRGGSNRGVPPVDRTAAPADSNPRNQLPRAASYTYIPAAKEEQYGHSAVVEIKGFPLSEYVPHSADAEDLSPPDDSPPDSSGWTTPDEFAPTVAPPQASEIATQLQKSTSSPRRDQAVESTRSSLDDSAVLQFDTGLESSNTTATATATTTPASNQRHPSKSFSRRFSRRSWYQSNVSTPSRSPSPTKQETVSKPESIGAKPQRGGRRKSFLVRTLTGVSIKGASIPKDIALSSDDQEVQKPVKRRDSILRRKSVRAAAGMSKEDISNSHSLAAADAPAVPALPKSFSTDRLPDLIKSQMEMTDYRAAPVPRLVSIERLQNSNPLSAAKKKDELWSVFRSLEGDHSKFVSKSTALKANVVRTSLIPFLRTYANHPSNKVLRPEDLDRRASILNKWWTGLIEMLHGRNNQSISGTDRPAILDGLSGLMERPEWRMSPSLFCPLRERTKAVLTHGSRSNASLSSSSSDFLTDSVHHNVRNIFIQNLSAQMAFVVDKMSLKNASASLVTFCGKACAHAFMFVPGMADVLVRLWDLPVDTIRRVLHENGIAKFEQMPEAYNDIPNQFPPALHQLGFISLSKMMRKLRTAPAQPLGTTHIEWWGHWVERWSGRESDLFYIFVKHFHILSAEFLPVHTSKRQRMCAPGMLLVHSQILTNLDATVHRDATQSPQDSSTTDSSTTFDEMLDNPDSVAPALPLPTLNATRLMAENRLVMLIREFLSDRRDYQVAKEIFARSFHDILQGAARGTSLFDHSACYTLLDFLEEALIILARYEQLRDSDEPIVDLEFWQVVSKKMINSENTMTEIRLYAFLYSIWNTTIRDRGKKIDVCLNFLLDADIFESRFNHWCPMVRAYFMRLLCWRVARLDSEDDTHDLRVLETLQERLQCAWAHYLYLRNQAELEHRVPPETSPCHPAPSRRLLIVRTDNLVTHGTLVATFDKLLKDVPSIMQKPASSSVTLLEGMESRPSSSASSVVDSEPDTRDKGIGGFFRKMMGGPRSRSKSRDPPQRQTNTQDAPLVSAGFRAIARAATDDARWHNSSVAEGPANASTREIQLPSHRSLSFKFSLDMQPNNKQYPPMRLFPPRLPSPAHAFLRANSTTLRTPESLMHPVEPRGASFARARYSGRALAEWTIVVGECHSFFERRKNEGVPGDRYVETPTLEVEVFKRPS